MPKLIAPLNVQKIDRAIAARKGAGGVELRDGAIPGLSLRIGPMGAIWALRAGAGGLRSKVTLGTYPQVGLADARRLAADAKAALRDGKALEKYIKFIDLVNLYERQECGEMKAWKNGKRTLLLVLKPLLDTFTNQLTFSQIQKLIDKYPAKSQSARCVRDVRPLLKWAKRRGHIDFSAIELAQPRGSNVVRQRVLTSDELKSIVPAITRGSNAYDCAASLILFTCCRLNEAALATWGEFDLSAEGGALWTLSSARRKGGVALTIPLTPAAVDALNRVGTGASDERVFKAMGNWSRWQLRTYKRTGTSGWHRHDLRRTGATVLGDLGTPPHIIEVVLGHKHLGAASLHSVYNKSRYTADHRAALEQLQRYYYETTS